MTFANRYKLPAAAARLPRRFASKYLADEATGCWNWTAARDRDGYGVFNFPWGQHYAHRVSYELHVGEIPDGFQIDHLCRNRSCVNPAHLEPVNSRTNTMRSPTALATINATKTHCRRGHAFDEINTAVDKTGKRTCRKCNYIRSRAYIIRQRLKELG